MGEVWRGTDVALERPVAIKLLREEYQQHAETVASFRAEARHAGSLSHPGVAQIYDYREADPPHPPYLVMATSAWRARRPSAVTPLRWCSRTEPTGHHVPPAHGHGRRTGHGGGG
ncbi:MAG: hypothetical protein ACM3ML_35705 [Micromonosporaceae bacterium]